MQIYAKSIVTLLFGVVGEFLDCVCKCVYLAVSRRQFKQFCTRCTFSTSLALTRWNAGVHLDTTCICSTLCNITPTDSVLRDWLQGTIYKAKWENVYIPPGACTDGCENHTWVPFFSELDRTFFGCFIFLMPGLDGVHCDEGGGWQYFASMSLYAQLQSQLKWSACATGVVAEPAQKLDLNATMC